MKYYSAIIKEEILPSATAWMDLESIMLREINQMETSRTTWFYSYVGYKTESNT